MNTSIHFRQRCSRLFIIISVCFCAGSSFAGGLYLNEFDTPTMGTAGASCDRSETLTVGASFVYADYGAGRINSSDLSGECDKNDIYFLGLHANWKE